MSALGGVVFAFKKTIKKACGSLGTLGHPAVGSTHVFDFGLCCLWITLNELSTI
jgi:hypothetical protein